MSPLVCKYPSELEYDKNWSWIMPVLERINNLRIWRQDRKELLMFSKIDVNIGLDAYYRRTRVSILGSITYCQNDSIPYSYKTIEVPHMVKHGESPIETIWLAVVDFIRWYNQSTHELDLPGYKK
jgi:hypothetical protein